eukprot:gnl/TRDRNA2_/TRDRNA2_54392_c0_seq1.p1 gnl/TRDRNA2_/TRDRNA2_54392_c0~~gnl/TRDRNA2_/TRDRNA2_54392_c0_seq1.p1  ORF type:complete len:535 (+),score=137.35 gnl/TRDRNA2_/TRDRNA2_54392_c0_seq1:171-1607(+)
MATIAKVPGKATIVKSPASAGAAPGVRVGLSAKSSTAPPASETARPAIAKIAASAAPPPPPPPQVQKDPIDAFGSLLATLRSMPKDVRLQQLTRLGESMGQSLPIDQINHFLRALQPKIAEAAAATAKPAAVAKVAVAKRPAADTPGNSSVPVAKAAEPASHSGAAQAAGAKPAGVQKASPPVVTKSAPAKAKPAVAKVPPAASSQTATISAEAATKVSQAASRAAEIAAGREVNAPPPPSPSNEAGLAESDPLYVLVGEFADDPVVQDGQIVEPRMSDVLRRLWDGACKKPKDWVAAYSAMCIPQGDVQSEVIRKLLDMAFENPEDSEKGGSVIAILLKGQRIKLGNVEQVLVGFGQNLDTLLAANEEAWCIYAHLLVHIFPKPQASGWGWSRVGWSWSSWWQFVEKCIVSVEPAIGADIIALTLRLIQDREGHPLAEDAVWSAGDKLQKGIAKLAELSAVTESEAVERLTADGVMT